jgi:VanZ family protein
LFRYLEKKRVFLVYIPLVIYWLILLAATSFPTISVPSPDISDKGYHFTAYFGLGILLNLTFAFQNKYPSMKKRSHFYSILIGIIYAGLDEIHQYFIPGRTMELLDFVADVGGLVLAAVFILFLFRINKFIPQ